MWALNAVCWHPIHTSTFSTGGSDGNFNFWDRNQKMRLRAFPKQDLAITAIGFNHDGKIFAYASGYDWARGYAVSSPANKPKLRLHVVVDQDVTKQKS